MEETPEKLNKNETRARPT